MRTYSVAVMICIAFVSMLRAAESPKWPKTVRELKESDFAATIVKDMLGGIALYNHPDEAPEDRAKRVIKIARVDLDGDSVPEFIVGANAGGSAGRYYDVYRKRAGVYEQIGALGAGFGICTLSKYNGFCQIEIWSRGGPNDYSRILYCYVKGEYRDVCNDSYRSYQGTYLSTQISKTP